ncbi:MAG: hypothetical protein U9O94_09520 [Nanoarchaeota archaeon]|nr:hypothetical protein [Nanoarchaeota archaeon]
MSYVRELKDYKPSGRDVGGMKVGIGVDLDGCVDPGMKKHCLGFAPAAVINYNLQAIQDIGVKAWMYINCYSQDAGKSRFVTLHMWADLLRESEPVKEMGVEIPKFQYLPRWTEVTNSLSTGALKAYLEKGDFSAILGEGDKKEEAVAELSAALKWSQDVDSRVPEASANITPFPNAVNTIRRAYDMGADISIVSGTPMAHVEKHIEKYGIDDCLVGVFPNEAGKKHASLATMMAGPFGGSDKTPLLGNTQGNYDVMLMVGDAPKDYEEAKKANALLTGTEDTPTRMFLVQVGSENESWAKLNEALDTIVKGEWSREDERNLINAGLRNLDRVWVDTWPIKEFPIRNE